MKKYSFWEENTSERKDCFNMTPLEKRAALWNWIDEWDKRLNTNLIDEQIEEIYNINISNIDNIFFNNTDILIKNYLENI